MAEPYRKETSVAVIGGGLVGPLHAMLLAKKGLLVDLYEARQDIRQSSNVGDRNRSINLTICVRGKEALREVGLEDTVLESAIPVDARMIHSLSGEMSAQPYGKRGQCLYSINRQILNELLLTKAEAAPRVSVHFEHKLIRANLEEKSLVFQVEKGEKMVKTDFIFGCDGAHSTVRQHMMRWRPGRLDYRQEYLGHGYKELTMPPTAIGEFAMPTNYLHIWPRQEFMMIALPNDDHTFTLTLFMPFREFESIEKEEDLLAFFRKHFPDSIGKIGVERLVRDYFNNPTESLFYVKCRPHFMAESTLILGDAAHAIVPFYGQGVNAGFEDCLILYNLLEQFNNNLQKAATRYSETRWKDTDTIADLSLSNYMELRAHVNSRIFLLRKYLDAKLHTLFPTRFIPLYTMVAFERRPYHKAIEQDRRQKRFINKTLLFLTITSIIVLVGCICYFLL